jgi:hypothetical protein
MDAWIQASIRCKMQMVAYITGLSDYGQQFIPTLLTVPCAVWIKHQIQEV